MNQQGQPEDVNTAEAMSMDALSEEALAISEPKRGQLREGVVMEVRDDGLIVDINSKLDGFVPLSDLQEMGEEPGDYEVGQTIPVVVTRPRTSDGNVLLSIAQAKMQEDWLRAEQMRQEETLYETTVEEANRGGLTVRFGRLRGFIPMSQLIGFSRINQPAERHRRLRSMVGKEIMLKVIEVDRRRRRLILSQLAAAKEWRAARRQRLLEELEAGQVRTGRISQITDFGLFVNLGGLDGLVHVSELSWGRIENPSEVYRIGQRVKVKVLHVDKDRQRIALSIKALTPDPWESAAERYHVGDLVEGKVSQMADFGIFVELEPGIEGLLHNSELISPEQREELAIGDPVLVKIIRVEPEKRRIGLSARQVSLDEWERWHAEHAGPVVEEESEPVEAEAEATTEATVETEDAPAAEEAPQAEAEKHESEEEA
jgi:small subunit ribosomal protein S1